MAPLQERFARELGQLLDETFENVHGIYLDKDTSLCQTLAQITAERASRSICSRGTSIAAHVIHLTFYLDLLERGMRSEEIGKVDWEDTWRVSKAAPAEWNQMQQDLKQTYQRLLATLGTPDVWEGEDVIGDAIAIVAHTAYHLGAIRQMLIVIE